MYPGSIFYGRRWGAKNSAEAQEKQEEEVCQWELTSKISLMINNFFIPLSAFYLIFLVAGNIFCVIFHWIYRINSSDECWVHLLLDYLLDLKDYLRYFCLWLWTTLGISFGNISLCWYHVIFKISLKYCYHIFLDSITRYLSNKHTHWKSLSFTKSDYLWSYF